MFGSDLLLDAKSVTTIAVALKDAETLLFKGSTQVELVVSKTRTASRDPGRLRAPTDVRD